LKFRRKRCPAFHPEVFAYPATDGCPLYNDVCSLFLIPVLPELVECNFELEIILRMVLCLGRMSIQILFPDTDRTASRVRVATNPKKF
jgi:hypothetical protein